MSTEVFPATVQEDEAEQARLFRENGRAFLEANGASDQADRIIEIVHKDGSIYRGTIADAIGGRCPEFRTIAECMVEVSGGESLAPTIDSYVRKSELKKKN